jgi:hypothetical protein
LSFTKRVWFAAASSLPARSAQEEEETSVEESSIKTRALAREMVAFAKVEAYTALGEEDAGIRVAEEWLRNLSC